MTQTRPDPGGRSWQFSLARLATAAFVLAVLVAGIGYGLLPATVIWPLVAAGVVGFLALVVAHDRHERQRRRAATRRQLEDEADARRARSWDVLARTLAPAPAPDDAHANDPAFAAIAADLDLFGKASLRQLLGRTATPPGDRRLLAWLRAATLGVPSDLDARQCAVQELASDAPHRTAALVEGLAAGSLRTSTQGAFHRWLDAPRTALASPFVGSLFIALPLAAILLVVADRLGMRVAGGWALLVIVAWTLRWLLNRAIAPAFAGADALSGEVRRYRDLLRLWEQRSSQAPWLVERQRRLLDDVPASTVFASLARIVDLSDLRWSHLPHVFVHSTSGWDLHVAAALERWRARHGARVAAWHDALADLDAAATLAGLTDLESGWTFPVVEPGRPSLEAESIAHPLLAAITTAPTRVATPPPADLMTLDAGMLQHRDDVGRVANDVAIGPPGRVLVVTGSNMSGKSTLLRTIGLNAVIAQMGGPVCAAALRMPAVRMETSLRLTDSLSAGVSYFMAALLRLKAVVNAADAPRRDSSSPRVLYLLDEVLQGTNSEERQVAIRHIVAHLVGTTAIGAITTHDLHLVQTPEFRAHADHVHFAEQIDTTPTGTPRLTFDYRLQPGPARSRNALALVRLVGLGHVSLDAPRADVSMDLSAGDLPDILPGVPPDVPSHE